MNLKILLIVLSVVSIASVVTLGDVANATTNDPNNTVAGIPKNSHDIDVIMVDIGTVEMTCPDGYRDDDKTKVNFTGVGTELITYDWRNHNAFEEEGGYLRNSVSVFAEIYVIDGIVDQNANYFVMVWGVDLTRNNNAICKHGTTDEVIIFDVVGKCDGSRMDIISRDSLGFNMTNITNYHAGCVA